MSIDRNSLLTLLFFLVSLAGAFFHELSLDEARPWMVVNGTPWGSVISETRCEIHCLPWFYALKGLSFFSADPFAMQVLSIVIGTVCFGLIARFSPFSFPEKLLLLCNYFFLFEYSLLARPYVLMTTGILLVCLNLNNRKTRPVLFLLSILFLENSTYFGIFLSIPFMSLFLYEILSKRIDFESKKQVTLLIALYFLIGFWYALPLTTGYSCFDLDTSSLAVNFQRFAASTWDVARSFFPLVTTTWNEHVFDYTPEMRAALSVFWVAFVFLTIIIFRIERKALYIFSASVFIIFCYRFCKPIYFGSFFRHLGALPVMYVGCVWIFRSSTSVVGWRRNALNGTFGIFLLMGAFSGISIYLEDLRRPFSHGRSVHEFISRGEYVNYDIIPDSLLFSSAYLVYSEREYFDYTVELSRRYFPLSYKRKHVPIVPAPTRGHQMVPRVPDRMLKKAVMERASQEGQNALVILNYPPSPERVAELGLQLEKSFNGAINPNEDFQVFKKKP